jgi:hypothetical protein
MLQGLSETCSQLKTLDVNGSLRVTNGSVEYIKKFQHLTILNLKGTKINCVGERNILSHLSNSTHCPLEIYGCSDIGSNHFKTLLQLIPNIQELRTASLNINAVGKSKQPAREAGYFHNLKILRTDYTRDRHYFLKELPKFTPHLQELEITGNCVRAMKILMQWPTLRKLFVRSYCIDVEITPRSARTLSSLQHLTLLTLGDEEAEILISRCQNLRKLELITHRQFYVSRQRILTQLPNLEAVSLGALGGHVPPETATLLSGRCSTTILLEAPQLASLYQHCPGVSVDTDRWLEITKPGLSEIIVHNKSGTCYRKLFCHMVGRVRSQDPWTYT